MLFFIYRFSFSNNLEPQEYKGTRRVSLQLLFTISTHFTDILKLFGQFLWKAHLRIQLQTNLNLKLLVSECKTLTTKTRSICQQCYLFCYCTLNIRGKIFSLLNYFSTCIWIQPSSKLKSMFKISNSSYKNPEINKNYQRIDLGINCKT